MLNKNLMMRMVILMTILFTKVNVESLITNDCAHGDVRLVGNNLRHQGIVEVCINLNWGRVCRDGWGYNDAAVVCKQLNYGSEGAIPTIWIGRSTVPIFLDNVDCQSSEATLLNCSHFKRFDRGYNCRNGGYAGVKCSEEQLRVQDVSIAIDNATTPTIVISWELYGGTRHKPSSFRVECFNRLRKEFSLWVNNGTITHLAYRVSVGDTLSSTFSACCVSAIHYGYYETRRRCTSTEILPPDLFTTSTPSQALNQSFTTLISTQTNPSLITPSIGSEKSASGGLISMRASIVSIGGVLGSIIVVLLLLLAVCGGALLFLLRSRNTIPKAQRPVDNNSAEFPSNSRYVTSTNSGHQAEETDFSAAADYSRIGPSYEMIDSRRQQSVAGRNATALVRLSERYEFSEPHLAMASAGGGYGGGSQGEASAMDYEVPLNSSQSEGHEEYSHLQH